MRKIIFLIVIFKLLTIELIATGPNNNKENKLDSTQHVKNTFLKGKVIDEKTRKPLTGVKIQLKNHPKKAYTNFSGYFKIPNLKSGDYNLSVSFISYEQKIYKTKVHLNKKDSIIIELQKIK